MCRVIAMTINQMVDIITGHTHLDIESRPNGGLPGTMEKRVLDWALVTLNHAMLGNIRGRSRWCKSADLDSEFLREGWEEGTRRLFSLYLVFRG
jgi:hypothetical protein